jgi:FkbM family methyltransferase
VPSEGFLYRRFAPLIPCALPEVLTGSLVLRNKWQVASSRDVFLSSHYWRLFEHLDTPPAFVVDLGGHCGHFVVLCELAVEERFGENKARYVVVEGMPDLVDDIRSTLADTHLASRCTVLHGLAGKRDGSADLVTRRGNRLDTSAVLVDGKTQKVRVPYVDLQRHIPTDQVVDVLKVDIEGSEYDFVRSYPDLLERTRLVLMEIHDIGKPVELVTQALEKAGLRPCLPHIRKGPNLLVLFKRES